MRAEHTIFASCIFSFFPKTGRRLLGIIILLFSLSSCEKADVYTMDPQTNFDALWRIINEHYCFFEYKNVDWNNVYKTYNQRLKQNMSQHDLFDLLADMLRELRDGHVNLISSFDMARYWDWFENYPRNFSEDILNSYFIRGYKIAGSIRYMRLSNNNIGYMYYSSFSNSVSEAHLDAIFQEFKDCEGLIIDVRDNGGGLLSYSDLIASRFLNEKIIVGYIMHKTGAGHNDFSDPYPLELKPSERIRWGRPVVVLTNRHCFSATNDFVNKMRYIQHVTIMGDRTGGGSGLPFNSELPNGWRVRFSASPLLDANKQPIEDGIDPDIKVMMQQSDIEKGKDTLIETAIEYLLNK